MLFSIQTFYKLNPREAGHLNIHKNNVCPVFTQIITLTLHTPGTYQMPCPEPYEVKEFSPLPC